jgi:hypothetical protein
MSETARCDQYRAGMRCVRNQHGEEIAHRNRHGSEWGGPEMIPASRWLRLRDIAAGDLADYREARENFQGNGEFEDVARVQAKIDATKCFLRYMDELEQS